jgi:hypothetical protein
MPSRTEVPEAYRQLFFVNAGGPSRKVVSRQVVKKKASSPEFVGEFRLGQGAKAVI